MPDSQKEKYVFHLWLEVNSVLPQQQQQQEQQEPSTKIHQKEVYYRSGILNRINSMEDDL